MIVFATGFDAMTGALQKMNIRGKKGLDCGKLANWATNILGPSGA